MKATKRICVVTGDWENFEVVELAYDLDETNFPYGKTPPKKVKDLQKKKTKRIRRESLTDIVDFDENNRENHAVECHCKEFRQNLEPPPAPEPTPEEIMCLKRRASLFFVVSFFALTIMLILGISLGTEHWIEATVQRNIDDVAINSSISLQPLKGFIGSNPIDGSDPGAFLGVVRFGLFSGCKRFNYGLGVRDPKCFSGKMIITILNHIVWNVVVPLGGCSIVFVTELVLFCFVFGHYCIFCDRTSMWLCDSEFYHWRFICKISFCFNFLIRN